MDLSFGYAGVVIGRSQIILADAFDWLSRVPPETLSGIVCDPPYGIREYDLGQIDDIADAKGVWRVPPKFDGYERAPLPRFTSLTKQDHGVLYSYFKQFATLACVALRPGGHMFIATNTFLSQEVYAAIIAGGMEFRTEIIRLVQTLRGGDRPKLGETEFPEVCSLPRGKFEPWGLFRKPLPLKMTVRDCLTTYGTGGLRRLANGPPFADVIPSERTSQQERRIAPHPNIKPQSFMRQIVRAVLPLGSGLVADPFMGAGSTVAAAEAIGYQCVGIERHAPYYELALAAIPMLANIY